MASGGSQPSLPSSSGLTSASTFSDSPTLEADLSSSEEETGESPSQEKSILDMLKAPQPSVLAHKHAKRCNPPVGVKKSKGLTLNSDPKSISPSDRLKEFPDQSFRVKCSNKLFCDACREVLSCKKSSKETHIKTKKHEKGKECLKQKAATEGCSTRNNILLVRHGLNLLGCIE